MLLVAQYCERTTCHQDFKKRVCMGEFTPEEEPPPNQATKTRNAFKVSMMSREGAPPEKHYLGHN
jgi:hypothetical protein